MLVYCCSKHVVLKEYTELHQSHRFNDVYKLLSYKNLLIINL